MTPATAGEALINSIEVSPHDPAAVYLAVAGYKMNDFTPRIYKTEDYGGRWRSITSGLPVDTFVRAVREDPDRKGLLYAGTETGVFVSFDGGGAWQPLQLELPEVPITDLAVRRQDLVAATQGRGFWIFDDLTPLHHVTAELKSAEVHLFVPRAAYLLGGGGSASPPPIPARTLRMAPCSSTFLKEEPSAPIILESLDAAGTVIRTASSEESDWDRCAREDTEPRNRPPIKVLPNEPGMNRWVWDLRRDGLRCISGMRLFGGLHGPRVVPGTYRARLTVGDRSMSQSFEVLADPRAEISAEDYAELDRYLLAVSSLFGEMMGAVEGLRRACRQIRDRLELLAGHPDAGEVAEMGEALIERISAWEEEVVQPRHETFDEDINWPNMLDFQTAFLLRNADGAGAPLNEGSKVRLRDVEARWRELSPRLTAIRERDVRAFNDRLAELEIPVIYLP